MNPSPQEKIKFVKDVIRGISETSPNGPIAINLYPVKHSEDRMDIEILSVGDQKRILRKLEENKNIKNLVFVGETKVILSIVNLDRGDKKQNQIKQEEKREDENLRIKYPIPRTISDPNKKGYLVLNGEKILLGGVATAQFRLIETLCVPFMVAKTTDALYEYIKMNHRGKNTELTSTYLAKNSKTRLIKSTFKETQRKIKAYKEKLKNKKLEAKLFLKSDQSENSFWLET
jgi:hypothetical protein